MLIAWPCNRCLLNKLIPFYKQQSNLYSRSLERSGLIIETLVYNECISATVLPLCDRHLVIDYPCVMTTQTLCDTQCVIPTV